MADPLLIEATPDLIDGWCGPGRMGDVLCVVAGDEVTLHSGAGHWWGHADDGTLLLDLRRAEVRDRVARIVSGDPGPVKLRRSAPGGVTWLIIGDRVVAVGTEVPQHGRRLRVPALADLDPTDDTRLPDGSRRVDALALAAAWRANLEARDG